MRTLLDLARREPILIAEVARNLLLMLVALGAVALDAQQVAVILVFVGSVLTILARAASTPEAHVQERLEDAYDRGAADVIDERRRPLITRRPGVNDPGRSSS